MATAPLTWQGERVEVTGLEKQVGDLWKQMSSHGSNPVRTHIFNLIVYANSRSEADLALSNLCALKRYHPSRTIVLLADRGAGDSTVDAQISIQCDTGTEDEPAGCHESLLLHVRGRAADHLASVVNPLILPELPTFLWWPGQPPFRHRMFHRLLAAADRLVIDSAQFDATGEAFADLAAMCSSRLAVHDFNWARLTPWREIIAQFFDGPAVSPYVYGIRSVRLEFGAGSSDRFQAASSTLLLLGWVASRLGWRPETTLDSLPTKDIDLAVLQGQRLIPISLSFRDHGADTAGRLAALDVESQAEGQAPAHFQVRRSDDSRTARVRTMLDSECRVDRVVPIETSSDAELLADELQITGRDALYQEVVAAASRLAGREAWNPS